jgi:acetyl-CoA carboxylase biotin carboxyl carrier protein
MKKPASKKASAARPEAEDRRPPPPPRGSAGRIDPALIEQIGDIANRLGLSEIEVQHDDLRIRVARQMFQAPAAAVMAAPVAPMAAPAGVIAPPPVAAAPSGDHPGAVKSPMVGTAYRRPSPNDKPFIEVGSVVKAGDKILLVEAMKTFNEITAPRAGTVTSIMVEDGTPVEYGQALVIIE